MLQFFFFSPSNTVFSICRCGGRKRMSYRNKWTKSLIRRRFFLFGRKKRRAIKTKTCENLGQRYLLIFQFFCVIVHMNVKRDNSGLRFGLRNFYNANRMPTIILDLKIFAAYLMACEWSETFFSVFFVFIKYGFQVGKKNK